MFMFSSFKYILIPQKALHHCYINEPKIASVLTPTMFVSLLQAETH